MTPSSAPSYPVSIFIAGDPDAAREICRDFCDDVGFCVTVTPTTYVYTGGQDAGVIIGLINYPRFPASSFEIASKAVQLADRLRETLGQESYSIQYPETTVWHSWREPSAQVDTHPKGGDGLLAPFMGSAVPEGNAP